jgi:hypothetical protein
MNSESTYVELNQRKKKKPIQKGKVVRFIIIIIIILNSCLHLELDHMLESYGYSFHIRDNIGV